MRSLWGQTVGGMACQQRSLMARARVLVLHDLEFIAVKSFRGRNGESLILFHGHNSVRFFQRH